MTIQKLDHDLTICRVQSEKEVDFSKSFYFLGKTGEEISLVCPTADAPANTVERDDGWKGFKIQGILDFSLVGILARLSAVLAENGIGIFAVSTFQTDYILVKSGQFDHALEALAANGYTIL